MRRKGMGKGLGTGYKNLVIADPYVHSLSAKGVKTCVRMKPKTKLNAYASYGFREFNLGDGYNIIAHWEKTRNGFRHVAVLMRDGREVDRASESYLNRTWESYEYQTVMQKLVNKTDYMTADQKKMAHEFLKKDHTDWTLFKSTAMVAQLGEVFGQTEKEKNDWKERMIKAGLGNKGLEMPDDWNTLTEAEKKKRLDKVIEFMGQSGN